MAQTSLSRSLWTILSLAVAAFALLWKLGAGSLAAWDETIYAQVSKEIVQSGDWLTLHWQYANWFEKPPLFLWITAVFYRVLGINEFAARLPSAISGLALLAVTYNIARTAYNQHAGWLAAIVLFTCYHFLSFSRFGTMEVMLTLFTYLAVYAYLRARTDQRWWYLVWVSGALGLMVKGAGGIVAPAVVLLALLFDKRAAEFRARHFWQAGLLALAIVLPWHALMYARHGDQFINEYLGYHVIARATTTLEGHSSSYLYYVARLIDGFFPMILLAPFAIVSEIRNRKKVTARSWILLLLVAFVFLLYTAIPTRRPWYILPLYPALAILVAAFVARLRQAYSLRAAPRRAVTAITAVLLVVAALYSLASLYLNYKPEEPVVKLARLAQSTSPADRAPLILFTNSDPYYAQVPLFYSNRPVVQAYDSMPPASEDAKRYVSFVRLADIVGDSDTRIILNRSDEQQLATQFELRTIESAGDLEYGFIRRK